MTHAISDILATHLFPTWEGKRKEIYRVTQACYWASADATNPFILRVGPSPHQALPAKDCVAPSGHSEH